MRVTNKQRGFSILEVVVSVGIISIILLSVALLSTKSLQMTQMAQMRQKATIYAREGIEAIRNDRAAYSWNVFKTDRLSFYATDTTFAEPETGFARTVSYIPVIGSIDGTVSITCEVSWTDTKGDHSVSQTTTLTRWL